MKKTLRRYLPDHSTVQSNRWLRPFANTLLHPRLWQINRRSSAGAIATGLFCGMIPGPFKKLTAALICIKCRVNLPLAILATCYGNPLTFVPIYFAAYHVGAWILGVDAGGFTIPPPMEEGSSLWDWMPVLRNWMFSLGKPLMLGLLVLACVLTLVGYFLTLALWRFWLIHAWRARRRRRPAP